MMNVGLLLYGQSRREDVGLQFDLSLVKSRLRDHFFSVEFGDEHFQRFVDILISLGGCESAAVRTAKRDAEERGPLFPFTVLDDNGNQLKGRLARKLLVFEFASDVSPELQQKAEEFLRSFELSITRNKIG